MTRVFLVAESSQARERLEEALESAEFQIAGVASRLGGIRDADLADVDVLLAHAEHEAPNEFLESVEDCGALQMTRVALMMGDLAPSWMSQALRMGVRGILPLQVDGNQLSAAIRAIAHGLVVLYPAEEQRARQTSGETYMVEALTPREAEVLQMIGQGKSNKEIAARLKISEHTAKFHVASLLGKLGAATRAEAVSIGMRRGLILL